MGVATTEGFERILDSMMRVFVGEEEFGFRKEKGAIDSMFIVRQMMERKLEFQQESCWDFLYLEKAQDKINGGMIPPVLRLHHVQEEQINMVMALYRTRRTQVRTCFGKTKASESRPTCTSGFGPQSNAVHNTDGLHQYKQCPMDREDGDLC